MMSEKYVGYIYLRIMSSTKSWGLLMKSSISLSKSFSLAGWEESLIICLFRVDIEFI